MTATTLPHGEALDGARKGRHPLEDYHHRTWATSNVTPFPTALNRRAIADLAANIVLGKHKGGLAGALREHGRKLFRAHVPRLLAETDYAEFEAELLSMIETVKAVHEGQANG